MRFLVLVRCILMMFGSFFMMIVFHKSICFIPVLLQFICHRKPVQAASQFPRLRNIVLSMVIQFPLTRPYEKNTTSRAEKYLRTRLPFAAKTVVRAKSGTREA